MESGLGLQLELRIGIGSERVTRWRIGKGEALADWKSVIQEHWDLEFGIGIWGFIFGGGTWKLEGGIREWRFEKRVLGIGIWGLLSSMVPVENPP